MSTPTAAMAEPGKTRPGRRRLAPWLALALLVLTLLAISAALQHIGNWGNPISVVIDGEEVFNGNPLAQWSPVEQFGAALALLAGGLVLLIVLPLSLLMLLGVVLGAALLVVLCVVGLPLLLAGGALLLVLSPLLLLVLLGWWLLKALL